MDPVIQDKQNLPYRTKFSADKIFGGQNFSADKIFGGQNFRHQVQISAVLSDEIFHRFLNFNLPYNSQEKYVLT